MLLWSNPDQPTFGTPLIPLAQGPADEVYFDLEAADAAGWSRFDAWSAFSSYLGDHYGSLDPAYDLDMCYRVSRTVFNRLQPALYLCWCGMNPLFAIPREVAHETGTPVLVWEAGMLPDTLLLDRGGVAVDSVWCGKDLPDPANEEPDLAGRYLTEWRKREIDAALQCATAPEGRKFPRVLVLGCMDVAAGVHRAQGSGPRTLPAYLDGIELAMAVASCHNGTTVYRPHPREPVGPLSRFRDTGIVIDTDSALASSILWADVVVGYGSKADYVALTLKKPLVLAGTVFLTGKGCTYEATTREALPGAIETALVNGMTAEQVRNYEKVTAWLLTVGCYNSAADGPCRQGIAELAAHAAAYASCVELGGKAEDILSPIGRERLAHGTAAPCEEPLFPPPGDPLKTVLDCLESEHSHVILDFDHTLFLGNSTEFFIATARPRLLAESIDSAVRRLGSLGSQPFTDRVRVLAVSLLMPWSVALWRRSAATLMEERWNRPLWEVVREKSTAKVVIASNGFRPLIDPLLRAAIRPCSAVPLIASDLEVAGRDIRTEGKVAAIKRDVPGIVWEQTVVVTDSLEDRGLLLAAGHGVLTRWDEPCFQPRLGYFPLRYVSRGKYPNQGYVKKLILGQDLVIWIVMFCDSLMGLSASLLLFISFYIVYEMGYYENDFKASLLEKNPTSYGDNKAYKSYGIHKEGWVWSVLLGFGGCLILENTNAAWSFAIWIVVLLSTRWCFFIYNRKTPDKRLPYYLVLQSLKNFAGVAVLLPTSTGLLLGASHLFQHATTYMVYRCGGDKELFPRALSRLVLFMVGVGVICVAGGSFQPIHVIIATAWLSYHALIERYGERWRIIPMVTHVLMRLCCGLKSLLFRMIRTQLRTEFK